MTTPSHETLREQLLDLAYGELGRGEARALEKHLRTCAECRGELQRMAQTRSAMSALGQEPAPARGEAVLLAAAREAARAQERRPFLPSWVWGASLGAVGLVVLGIVSVQLVGRLEGPGAPPPMDAQVASAPPAEAAQAQPAPAKPAAPPASAAAPHEQAGEDRALEARREEQAAEPPAPARPAVKAKGDGARARRDDALAGAAGAPAAEPRADKKVARPAEREAEAERFAKAPPPAKAAAPGAPAQPPEAVAEAAPPPPAASDRDVARARSAAPAASASGARAAAPSADDLALDGEVARAEKSEAVEAKRRADAGPSNRRSAGAAAAAIEDPIARHARLRAAGRLRTVTRAFRSCAGEAERAVELDDQGAVVKVTRRGTRQGQPFEVELFYADDGRLAAARWSSEGRVREVRAAPGAALAADGVPPAALQPDRAAAAGPDAPPRCAF